MDGNGRWAQQRGLPRVAGHRAGAEAVRRALQAAADNGVEVLTIYAFSSENWRRSDEEISDLTALMRFYLERELKTLEKEGVRLKLIGNYSAFGGELVERLERAVQRTANNTRLTLVIALNYGSRAEIAGAARKLAEREPCDLPARALFVGPAQDLASETDGEDFRRYPKEARDEIVAKLVEEDQWTKRANERNQDKPEGRLVQHF
jgi:undecaprenyl diphosphate synthase